MRRVILALGAVLWAASAQADEYRFEDFPAPERSARVVDQVDLPEGESVEGMFLERAVGESPNFAGRYVLTFWGCGTACQQVAAISVESGEVFYPGEGGASNGACFRIDSRLLIVNPIDQEGAQQIPDWFHTYFYEMTDDGFKLLGKTREGLSFQCD
ncbi:hypothetical protein [Marinobacter zhejiangensis]|uniref:Lipoprotein n=1 Tax=Marinobacter zhejiangensis TaxID=488535 RepID=A0A1I4Q061_9GAMM|nr:hypothetical protein [Marinobacter zhejiangensis]SFM33447.1 hypothetical protein SAMN04487963_2107 [Marinobacter zhejiangensis]